jgi:hypothetical protein
MATFMQRACVKVAILQPGRVRPVQWLFTGVLLASCGGILAFTGYLLRRLFTTAPAEPEESKP